MKRKFRLSSSTEFQRVRRFGRSYAHPLIVLVTYPRPGGRLRIGVAAGRAVGNAVQRNRAKRRLRAALRPWLESLPPGWDLVWIARRPITAASFPQIQTAVCELLRRAQLLTITHDV